MSRLKLALLTVASAATIALACYEDDSSGPVGTGTKPMARVLLTDGPFPYDTVDRVDIYIVSIAASTEMDTSDTGELPWVTITEPRRRVNLLELQQGTTTLLGEGELPADEYRAVRMVIDTDSSSITMMGGVTATVHWGSAGEQALHAFVEDPVSVPAEGAEIVIDFDVGRSFDHVNSEFTFIPWIRAVNKAATGSIAGTIETDGDSTPLPTGPMKGARVSAWGNSQGNWQIRSTAPTDADGHYRLAYLRPGTYIVQVDPPATGAGPNFGSNLDSNVVVSVGAETPHSVTLRPLAGSGSLTILGASSMLANRTNRLEAIVISGQQQHPDTAVAWQNLDPAVLDLVTYEDSTRIARVTSKIVGTGRIVATSGSLADTLVIQVAPDSSSN